MASHIHIGTSGWSYKHWRGIFYDEQMKETDYLAYYAQHFSVTEINTSFYHLPAAQTVLNWTEKVSKGFIFCPKISRYITHMKKLHDPADTLPKFFDVFDLMLPHLGPVLIQLPASLHYHEDVAEPFFSYLYKHYKKYIFALEARHESWLTPEAFALMKKYKIAWVISQSGHVFPYNETVTAKHIYIRFHGPDALYGSSYTDETLTAFAEKFKKWEQEGHVIWAFFNNDIGGYALVNAKRLIELVK